jgi:hypothetical protein
MLTYVQVVDLKPRDVLWHQGNAWSVVSIDNETPSLPGRLPGLTHTLTRGTTNFRYSFTQVKEMFCTTKEESLRDVDPDPA